MAGSNVYIVCTAFSGKKSVKSYKSENRGSNRRISENVGSLQLAHVGPPQAQATAEGFDLAWFPSVQARGVAEPCIEEAGTSGFVREAKWSSMSVRCMWSPWRRDDP